MKLKNRNVVLFVEKMFNDLEFWYPYYRLKEEGARVVVVGSGSASAYIGKSGTQAKAEMSAEQIKVADFDGLVIPGGYAPDIMRRYPAMVALVAEFFDQNKLVAAICHAGWMLASAKILKGRTVTSFFAIRDDLEHAGAQWVDREAVVDGHLITSRDPDDLPAFMRAIISYLELLKEKT
jgi:protease I